MRFVVFGAGAIGGVVGARLHQAGHRVSLIARGAHLDAIRERGLTLVDPAGSTALEIEAFGSPAELHWEGDEVVALAMKSQDTAGALGALRAAAPHQTPVVCMQNGVDNERQALRLFQNVYGAVVMLPAAHTEPGVVESHASRLTGIVDVGRYPSEDCCVSAGEVGEAASGAASCVAGRVGGGLSAPHRRAAFARR